MIITTAGCYLVYSLSGPLPYYIGRFIKTTKLVQSLLPVKVAKDKVILVNGSLKVDPMPPMMSRLYACILRLQYDIFVIMASSGAAPHPLLKIWYLMYYIEEISY